ncbi:Histone chaperone asf1 [Maudiozyma exigua]|uniref:Histone chaperone n=1 Tax=Maudiozyma exigua TaxID=34358 RepID=A0A9P7B6A4_MAUEX|nr:Histone chaperone asf1 [Kazachstania exigua]
MSIVSLLGIKVLNNPAKFSDSYEFEITFECLEPLKNDLEWKLTYVGSSRSLEHDQELDSILVGPVPVGVNKFVFSADPPSAELIPASELVSVTVILLSCSYDGREFVRVGYYVNNEYDSEELRENPPAKVQVDHIVRNILAEKPRVTRFNIVWDNENEGDFYPPEQPEVEEEEEEEDEDEDEEEEEDEDEEEEEEEEDDDVDEVEEKAEADAAGEIVNNQQTSENATNTTSENQDDEDESDEGEDIGNSDEDDEDEDDEDDNPKKKQKTADDNVAINTESKTEAEVPGTPKDNED